MRSSNREVELRGFMTRHQQEALSRQLESEGARFEHDDKRTIFYEYPGGILKLSQETAKSRAKLSLKLGDETKHDLEEYDLAIAAEGFDATDRVLRKMGYEPKADVPQKRRNYFFDDVVLSLKHTPDWGYHFEAEYTGPDTTAPNAIKKLQEFCSRYSLTPLAPKELASFLDSLSAKVPVRA